MGDEVAAGGSAPAISRLTDDTLQMAVPAAAVVAGVAVAVILCAYGFFSYTLDNFPAKGDKWKHCYTSCKIATWCGGFVMSALIGAGKEVADWIGDKFGAHMQAEWEDFVADMEGNVCSFAFWQSCQSCCDEKRPG